MKLPEFQKKYRIKRINFDKVHRNLDLDREHGTDEIICPYCGEKWSIEAEEIDDCLGGMTVQCGFCDKNFRVEGAITIETTCTPMEDAVLDERENIERNYRHMDECAEKGCEWDDAYGVVEWEMYRDYARPLFENAESEGENETT